MTPSPYTEDTLVQETTADYLERQLGWESVYAHNHEDFGPDSLLGRASERDVVLERPLRERLAALNPDLPSEAYDDAVRRITATSGSQTIVAANREQYDLMRDGVQVTCRDEKGKPTRRRLRVIDFDDPGSNHFLCVRELWVRGALYRRRPDIVGFVNGLPLLFIECKNIHRDLKAAFEKNYADYRDTVPHLFHHNGVVMFGNGEKARIGSITSRWGHFHEWKRLAEDEPGAVDMETLLRGVCDRRNFLDLVESFILFDESTGETRKILARNHQFLGVNRAVEAVRDRRARNGKLGVFWHTQGAGKSYSMVMFSRKVHRKLGGNFTFLVLTDRDDLDTQIYKTYAGCGVVDHDRDPCRAGSGGHLRRLLGEHKSHVFSLIQKFNQDVDSSAGYTRRDDVIERTFEEPLKFVQALEKEEGRALREGLDEESLAVFDLLKKPDLGRPEVERIKKVAKDLLWTLKAEKLRVDQWREKDGTQSAVKVAIHDFLYSDETGLPASAYSEDDVAATSEAVFAHVYRAYPTVPSPYYDGVAAA